MARRKTTRRKQSKRESWVQRVRETSDAMDLPLGIFKRSPKEIARGLKQSVLRSRRTKGTKFQSAMSMLGRSLARQDRQRLEAAKIELRRIFGRQPRGRARSAA
ncbi:MAG TPA: DUF3175 domain-containing protein [Methylomirabilota bacterium]|jgi:hypothetical protein|nr:DUF3175 domain-containing protein [Methylomirabilota bacterium]